MQNGQQPQYTIETESSKDGLRLTRGSKFYDRVRSAEGRAEMPK